MINDAKVRKITKTEDFEVVTDKGSFHFDRVILCCGGSSFSRTGSTGDSYKFAEKLGHQIEPIRGALVPVAADSGSASFCKDLGGVSVTAGVSLFCDDKKTASLTGEILFADFGLTGPAVMEISREVPSDLTGRKAWLELDLVPSMNDEEFDLEFRRQIGAHRKRICREVKHLRIGIGKAPEIEKAYVTRGGVSLSEIDRKTMKSKLVSGLYITGEALDVDGISGGYNLQACMSEAYLAVKDILEV